MIRLIQEKDMHAVLSIWLQASIKAHHFIPTSYWTDHLQAMETVYIPSSVTYVLENDRQVVGFLSLIENHIAAIFIDPDQQSKGFGQELMAFAKHDRDTLTLSVYQKNGSAVHFYKKQGFRIIESKTDEETNEVELTMQYLLNDEVE